MDDRAGTQALGSALRAFGLIILPFGLFWAAVGLAVGAPSLAALGLIAASFCAWLLFEASRATTRTEANLATRVAAGTQLAAFSAVVAEPMIGVAIALASLIPVVLAMPYVRRASLSATMAISSGVGAFALAAPALLPWGTRDVGSVAVLLPISGLVTVYVLFLLFLWNASTRLTDTASELRHVIEMSHDLAGTLDPADVGHRLARHIALVAHADDCVLSTWDPAGDRVVTLGSYPAERGRTLEPAYDLDAFPATRRVLAERSVYVADIENPAADQAEVEYLRSIGRRTLVMLPLVVRGMAIGIVELTSSRTGGFSDREVGMAQILVREAAATFDNTRLYDELRQLAYRDSLTGLANRARLQDRTDHVLDRLRGRSEKRAALLFIDLDHFKHLNDRFGHAQGDQALRVIAERIKAIVRPGDTAGRLGGDEFAVLLEDVESADVVTAVCERLLESLNLPVELETAAPIIGGSIGYAMSGPDVATSDDLLRNADIAMYAAKAVGGGQIVAFRPDLLDTVAARSELATMLRGAESRHELRVHYQPVVALDDGVPVGVEALVRWQPPDHVLHLPADFLELAEETGEILPIGRWVIAEGCRRVRAWQTRYDLPNLRLYVNLSARQFHDPGLVPMIVAALARSGLDAANLTLEITEATLLRPGFETVQRIGELRALGLRLAIDDFGTGFSSLGYLHAFQIDELKIDRSFVSGGGGVGDAHVLSQVIVDLGRALSLDVIAEGIETTEQADWFLTLGCRFGQGFLYSHPVPASEMDRYLRSQVGMSRSARRIQVGDSRPVPIDGGRFTGTGITDVLGSRKAAG